MRSDVDWDEDSIKNEIKPVANLAQDNKKEVEEKFPEADSKEITIMDLFDSENPTHNSSIFKLECPQCGLQGGRTEGFILFPDGNRAFCQSSGKWFRMLEAYALKKGIIQCLDGRETDGDSSEIILEGELFTETLEQLENEFGKEMYAKLTLQLHIKEDIQSPSSGRYVSDFAKDLGIIYKLKNILFYRGEFKQVVEIMRYKKITKDGEETIETGFNPVNSLRFVTLIEKFIRPYTYKKSGDDVIEVFKSISEIIAKEVLVSENFQTNLPAINRIFKIPIPMVHKDTNELTFPKKGYDKRFGSWLPYNAPEIIKMDMTLKDAKELIELIFAEFCFAEDKDRTRAIAGFITPFIRGLLPKFTTRTPVLIYMANRERAGKDYCAGCTGIIYEGSSVEQPAISNETGCNDSELQKKITACMMQGKKRFHSANNKGLLNSTILESISTAEIWEDRILGKTQNVKVDNEMDFSLSGNLGIRLTPDLANRSRIINLHLVDEDANARIFKKPNLHGWILKHREIILSALYTLVRNWIEKGMKPGTVPFTSFPEWASVCGGIMEAAGWDNPCDKDSTNIVVGLDEETLVMKELYEACYAHSPNTYLRKSEIIQIGIDNGIIDPYMDRSEQTKFGIKIQRFNNRIEANILMLSDGTKRASNRKYKFTKSNNENIAQIKQVEINARL